MGRSLAPRGADVDGRFRYNEQVDAPPPSDVAFLDHGRLLREFLAGDGMGHDWWVRLILKHGKEFAPSPLPADVPVMQPRCCYLNSFTLAREQPERFTYYEGFASMFTNRGWGTGHAWCVEKTGRVVDATWPNIKSDQPAAYFGLALPLDIVEPFVGFESRGTLSEWIRADGYDDLKERLPGLLGIEPL